MTRSHLINRFRAFQMKELVTAAAKNICFMVFLPPRQLVRRNAVEDFHIYEIASSACYPTGWSGGGGGRMFAGFCGQEEQSHTTPKLVSRRACAAPLRAFHSRL
jgi:hypothetical protein